MKKFQKTYEQNMINKTYNNYELISLLYEKLLQNCFHIEKYIENKDIKNKIKVINNSIDIITELSNSLNFNEGEISYYLYGIYTDLNRRLVNVNASNSIEELHIIKNVIKELYSAWKEEISKLSF